MVYKIYSCLYSNCIEGGYAGKSKRSSDRGWNHRVGCGAVGGELNGGGSESGFDAWKLCMGGN